ncbi:MAG: class I tRNA ligase family protein, partial [Candidatus Omnitrophota bacterium]|nr:class I tRNA ligase family protein [Candidatus Omnitrophota bacterium]
RFMLSNLYDFNPDDHKAEYSDFRKIDRWMLSRVNSLMRAVDKSYDDFQFHKAYKSIYDFCNEDLSMYYLDMVKGRLYTYAADAPQRRAAQTVLYAALNCLVRVISPILVFTAEEIWQNMPKQKIDSRVLSVHLLDWPLPYALAQEDNVIEDQLAPVLGLIPEAAKALEEMRGRSEIGSSFDGKINILTKTRDRYTFLQSFRDELPEIFKVSQVEVTFKEDNAGELSIEVKKAEGKKCPRCWNYSLEIGSDIEHPLICDNCRKAVGGN